MSTTNSPTKESRAQRKQMAEETVERDQHNTPYRAGLELKTTKQSRAQRKKMAEETVERDQHNTPYRDGLELKTTKKSRAQRKKMAKETMEIPRNQHNTSSRAEHELNPTKKNRAQRKKTAEETMEILENQHYTSSCAGLELNLCEPLRMAIEGTVTYDPTESAQLVQEMPVGNYVTTFEVALERTLTGCARLSQEPFTAALNFASAKNPGGGFLNGSLAQEEELATASGMFVCINQSPMYEANRKNPERGLYQHYMIFSPDVPVFRDDDGVLLDVPYTVNILTVPAVNVGAARKNKVAEDFITQTMRDRMDRMLAMALHHNMRNLILGAWGCGVFRGDVEVVASMFSEALLGKYRNQFQKVIFCVLEAETKEIFEFHFRLTRRVREAARTTVPS